MVSGDIDALPVPAEPAPEEPVADPIEAEAFEERNANGFSEAWLAPVVFVDDVDDVSALRASIADEAAPKAKNMAELQQCRGKRPTTPCAVLSKRHASKKNPIKPGFPASDPLRSARQ